MKCKFENCEFWVDFKNIVDNKKLCRIHRLNYLYKESEKFLEKR